MGVLYHTAVRLNEKFVLHQEKEILSSLLTFTQVVPNLYELLSSTEPKMIFCEMQITEQVLVPTDFHTIFFPFLPNILFYIQQNKEAHTGLEQHESKL